MPILLKRKNGEITPFRNADFIPAFYFIPKSILDRCGSELNSIPRNPRKLLQSWDAIAMVESDLFLLAIIDAYAYMVWPFMGLGAKREIYSGYEPSWIFAHAATYWIQEMQEEKILPAAKELLKNGGVDEIFGYLYDDNFTLIINASKKPLSIDTVEQVQDTEASKEQPIPKRPKMKLVGQDGNIFAILGRASRLLKENGQPQQAKEMSSRVYQSGDYYKALNIISEYVETELSEKVPPKQRKRSDRER